MLFDSHCHLNFSTFKDNYHHIIADCLKEGIGLINIGSQFDTSRRAVEIANEYPHDPIYASIGLHPIHLSHTKIDEEEIKFRSREEKFDSKKYQELLNNDKDKKIVAIGEIGLDYWHVPDKNQKSKIKNQNYWKDLQKDGFIKQLEFARKNNLPVILHARGSKGNLLDVYEDILDILRVTGYSLLVTGIIHCFGSTLEIAKKFLDMGFYIGFTGVITFKNKSIDELRKVVKFVPLDKILVETDAPYLAPEPYRGQKCLPQYVEFVAKKVAEIKNVSYKEVCGQTTENVKELFLSSSTQL